MVWDFRGEESSSHGNEKQMFGKQIFAGPSLTTGQTGLWSDGPC